MWPFGFVIPATTANDLRLRRIFYPRLYPLHLFSYLNSWERASIFPFQCWVLNKGTTGTIFITSLVWHGPWMGIEPGTSRTGSQHYTTRLSRRRYCICMCVCVRTCLCACVFVCERVWVRACLCACVYVCAWLCAFVHVFLRTCLSVLKDGCLGSSDAVIREKCRRCHDVKHSTIHTHKAMFYFTIIIYFGKYKYVLSVFFL